MNRWGYFTFLGIVVLQFVGKTGLHETPRDPAGIHQVIWDELSGVPFDPRPAEKPLTVASYDAGGGLTAYVDPVAVDDDLPDAALFLAPGWYVTIPLERTYAASCDVTPQAIRNLLATFRAGGEPRT